MKWAASSRGPPHSLQLGSPGVVLFLLYLNRLASDSRPWQPASRDHVRDHAHFRHDAFFRAFDQVALHTAVKGGVAALETAPEASQAL